MLLPFLFYAYMLRRTEWAHEAAFGREALFSTSKRYHNSWSWHRLGRCLVLLSLKGHDRLTQILRRCFLHLHVLLLYLYSLRNCGGGGERTHELSPRIGKCWRWYHSYICQDPHYLDFSRIEKTLASFCPQDYVTFYAQMLPCHFA